MTLRLLVAPERPGWAVDAVTAGGAATAAPDDAAEGLIWVSTSPEGLLGTLGRYPTVRWVQLPLAGVERVLEAGVFSDERARHVAWTCAKGTFAEPVAEHALALALAGLRHLPQRARTSSWGQHAGTSLYDAPVTILGAGGITEELLRLLAPLRVQATVVRRSPGPVDGAHRTVTSGQLAEVLPAALVVFVALALVPETVHIIGAPQLSLMSGEAWLVNVGRGRHVDSDALVSALTEGKIGGAALDVTDPEPLPDGHPLWSLPNCLITPHTANTAEMAAPLLARRIRDNVQRFVAGLPLIGTVDTVAGY